jgi:hypothetical protein
MKYIRVFFLILIFVFSVGIIPVRAQSFDPFSLDEIATDSAEATMSAREATASSLVKRVVEKEPDITQDKPEVKGKLERYIEENTVGSLSPFNFMRHGIIYAVSQGVPANTIVLILLFPLVATLVIISRHVIGLKSFGIFTPALLAVAFLATGLITGILLFFVILAVATFIRMLLRETRIQYLPRMAIFMWFISMSIFGVLIVSPSIGQEALITIGIFPILILILSVEAFLDVQITRSFPQALRITFETLIVALGCFNLMNMESLQKFSLVHPELFTISILVVIAVVESYSGLRLLELWRFRKVIKP